MLDYAVFNIHRLRNIHEREVRSAGGNIRPTTVLLTLATLMQIDRKQSTPDMILRDSLWGKRALFYRAKISIGMARYQVYPGNYLLFLKQCQYLRIVTFIEEKKKETIDG